MMKKLMAILCALFIVLSATAQERKVQNRPYTDLRQFHFGIHVGAHMQDIEFINAGPIVTTDGEGIERETFITCDQDRVDPGFQVGVLGELRLNEFLQFRVAPALYFGSRHLSFHNMDENATITEARQDLKSAYITTALDLIFAAPRCNNHRAYMMAGVTPTLNLTGKSTDYLRLKNFQTFIEVGFGLDEYLPYFKCRPELKFMFGLGNSLDMGHADELRDKNMCAFTRCVKSAHTKMITLTFFFE